MNQLEQLREQCAKVASSYCIESTDLGGVIAKKILALPLPEVKQEPVAEVADDFIFTLRKQPDGSRWPVGTKLYVVSPDAEALRKENEELHKAAAQALSAIEAFTDPEDRMPAETGEFKDLGKAVHLLRSVLKEGKP